MAKQEGGMWLYKAGVPRFSLVLWSKPFREGKLRLPKGFAKEHGAQLANEVLLKLPNGAEWQVTVVRGRKRIWFVKGWREFAEFYSLKPTNYLVFGLVSRGRLNVIIFDTTATEIDYSNTKVNVKVEPDCDVTSNEAVQRPSPSSPKATVKPSLKPHKLRTKNVKGRTASGEELDGHGNGKQGKQIKDELRSCTPRRTKSAYRRTDNERANVVFESENPRATESDFTCRPNKHGNSPKTSLGSPQPHKLRRTNGMDGIASSSKEGNSLVPGDVCVFELMKGEQEEDADDNGLGATVACVHVFRG
ncbi:B3 domain-containing transcription factor VRN1 [Linum perenne]